MNAIIDKKIPGCPRFHREEIVVAGESFEVYFRDIIECIKALFADPKFASYLVFLSEQHFIDNDHKVRLYHDIHTGKWWWSTQVCSFN